MAASNKGVGKALAPKPVKPGEQVVVTEVREETRTFSGPLPHPEILQKYNEVIPGGADRIFKMAEEEALHRRAQERDIVRGGIDDDKARATERRLGQIFGLVIGLAAIGGGAYTASVGQPWAGSFIGGAGVGGLVLAFVLGSKRQPTE